MTYTEKARRIDKWLGPPYRFPCIEGGWTCGDCPAADAPSTAKCQEYARAYLDNLKENLPR
jgi:hypothetical protein